MKKMLSLLMVALFALSLTMATFAEDKAAASGDKSASTEGKKKTKKTKKTTEEKKAEKPATK
jgi:hypothetical protein